MRLSYAKNTFREFNNSIFRETYTKKYIKTYLRDLEYILL